MKFRHFATEKMASTNESDDEKSPLIQDRSANHDSVAILSSTSSFVRDAAHFSGRYHKLLATMCILLTELCERLTFYGLTANLVLLCKDQLALPSPLPSTITLVFIGKFSLILKTDYLFKLHGYRWALFAVTSYPQRYQMCAKGENGWENHFSFLTLMWRQRGLQPGLIRHMYRVK